MLKQKLENWIYKCRLMRCYRLADKQLKKLLKIKRC